MKPNPPAPNAALRPQRPSDLRLAVTRALAALAVGFAAAGAGASDYTAGNIEVRQPYATPTPPGSKIGAAYFAAENRGPQDDRLLGASSPAAARVEIHSGEIGTDGVMRMRELDAVALPAGKSFEMKPGQGNHLMLMELGKPLKEGDSFPMTLEFERGGKVEVQVRVQAAGRGARNGHGHSH